MVFKIEEGRRNSKASLYDVLSAKPNLNKLTAFTTLMRASDGEIETWRQFCEDDVPAGSGRCPIF